MPRRSISSTRLALVLGVACAALAGAAGATVPAGFTDALLADNVGAPTAIAFVPDGRILITAKTGALRVVQGGALLATPAVTVAVGGCTDSERGLLGVAVHPDYSPGTPYIYLYYTFDNGPGCQNRVSRFILPTGSNVINAASELVMVDNMPSPNGNHNAGDLQFGRDGHLYITIGDGGPSANSRLEHVLTGKVLRITADGGIPRRQSVPGRRHRALQRHGSDDSGQPVPGDLRLGFPQPVPHDARPQQRRYPLLRQRRGGGRAGRDRLPPARGRLRLALP